MYRSGRHRSGIHRSDKHRSGRSSASVDIDRVQVVYLCIHRSGTSGKSVGIDQVYLDRAEVVYLFT